MNYIYIDYENLPGIEIVAIKDARILVFVGDNQTKIPRDTVVRTQPLGDRVQWITISGTGRNALDFHIAYYLARFNTDPADSHYIVSRDAGFDPLIKHTKDVLGQNVKRVVTFKDITQTKPVSDELEKRSQKVRENLKKLDKGQRPKSRKTLQSTIAGFFQGKLSDTDVGLILENLFRERFIEEKNRRIAYLD